jgi:hypothetical protein
VLVFVRPVSLLSGISEIEATTAMSIAFPKHEERAKRRSGARTTPAAGSVILLEKGQ